MARVPKAGSGFEDQLQSAIKKTAESLMARSSAVSSIGSSLEASGRLSEIAASASSIVDGSRFSQFASQVDSLNSLGRRTLDEYQRMTEPMDRALRLSQRCISDLEITRDFAESTRLSSEVGAAVRVFDTMAARSSSLEDQLQSAVNTAEDLMARSSAVSSIGSSLEASGRLSKIAASVSSFGADLAGTSRAARAFTTLIEDGARFSHLASQVDSLSSLGSRTLDDYRRMTEPMDQALKLSQRCISDLEITRAFAERTRLSSEFGAASSVFDTMAARPSAIEALRDVVVIPDYSSIHFHVQKSPSPRWYPGADLPPQKRHVELEARIAKQLGADPAEETVCVAVYVPSKDRHSVDIPGRERFLAQVFDELVELGGGATQMDGTGGWNGSDGKRVVEPSSKIVSFISKRVLERQLLSLRRCLHWLGLETNQDSIGLEINGKFFLISHFDRL
jgi:hypothetical protein